MAKFVLVHGAWHGAWCWYKVASLLRQGGHTVITPDLPGHGIDRSSPDKVTLENYTDCVCEILSSSKEPVILVGHSMGGFVITQAAERYPSKVTKLVYLAAVLTENGTPLLEYFQHCQQVEDDSFSEHEGVLIDQQNGVMTLTLDSATRNFYADCSHEDIALAQMLLTPQPLLPFFLGVQISTANNWGSIPRHYIECSHDKALPLEMQRDSHKKLPCSKVITMNTSHSPFFSAPEELVNHLVSV